MLPWHRVILPAEIFEMTKCLWIIQHFILCLLDNTRTTLSPKSQVSNSFTTASLISQYRKTFKTFQMMQINQPTRCGSFTSLLLDVYVWLNMFWAPLRPSSGAYNCTGFTVGEKWLERCWSWTPVHDQQHSNHHAPTIKPVAPSAVVRSWWWAKRCPKHAEPHINVK